MISIKVLMVVIMAIMPSIMAEPKWYFSSDILPESTITNNLTTSLRRARLLTNPNNASLYLDSDSLTTEKPTQFDDVQATNETDGRSAKSLTLDAYYGQASDESSEYETNGDNREGRIVNDNDSGKKPNLSIKGFIPIVGYSSDKPEQPVKDNPARYNSNNYHQSSSSQSQYSHQDSPSSSYPQHVAGPQDQRFIGAALQNLAATLAGNPTRKYGNTAGNEYGPNYANYASYGNNLPSVTEDCICVPFYLCKNGFIEQTAKNAKTSSNPNRFGNINRNIQNFQPSNINPDLAQSIINQLAAQSQSISSYKPQSEINIHSQQAYNQDYLPVDERSLDKQNSYNENATIPQYADEVLARMLGLSNSNNNNDNQNTRQGRSSGCGLLRTCCKVAPAVQPQFGAFPSPVEIHQDSFINAQPGPPHHGLIGSHSHASYPDFSKPTFELTPAFENMRPNAHQAQQILETSYGYAEKPYESHNQAFPPHNSRPNIPLPIKPQHYPQQQQYSPYGNNNQHQISSFNQKPYHERPEHNVPTYSSNKPIRLAAHPSEHHQSHQFSHQQPHNPNEYGLDHHYSSSSQPHNPNIYGTCGVRNSIGIHGRVQNLQYHETATEFGEYPWQAAILKRLGPADSLYVCGGTLISPIFIATAAHCIKTNQAHDLKVRLGEWDVHREDEFYPHTEKFVQEIIVHPQYFPGNLNNDIALLRLDSPVDLNVPHIAPACLPEQYENFAGQRCIVTGWGKNVFGQQGEFQSVLKEVDLPVLNHAECENAFRRTRLGPYYKLHPSMTCAGGEPGKDACEGDGGSPLVCETKGVWKIAGLVSWGLSCGQPGVPGVYVNMAYERQWIDSIIQRFIQAPPSYGSGLIHERSNAGNDTLIEAKETAYELKPESTSTQATTTTTSYDS